MHGKIPASHIAALALLAVFVVLHHLHWSVMPLERDTSTYAVIARELLRGRSLYAELWDHKPPGIHLAYSLGILVFGYSDLFIAGMWSALTIAITCGTYLLLTALVRKNIFALWGAAVCALLFSDIFLETNAVNTELFIALFLLPPFAQLFTAGNRGTAALSGISLGIAAFFKQIAIIPYLCAAIVVILSAPANDRRAKIKAIFITLLLSTLPWLLLAAWAQTTGHWDQTYAALVTFNRSYAGDLSGNAVAALDLRHLFPRCCYILLPLFFLSLPRIFYRPARREFILAALLLGSLIAVALPGRFYNHYYELLIVPCIIGSALALDGCSGFKPRFSAGLASLLLCAIGGLELCYFRYSPEELSVKRHGPVYLDSKKLGLALRDAPPLFQLGNETGIYFYSQHSPLTTVAYLYPMQNGALKDMLMEKTVKELTAAEPRVIVSTNSELNSLEAQSPLRKFLSGYYHSEKFDDGSRTFSVYVRDDR